MYQQWKHLEPNSEDDGLLLSKQNSINCCSNNSWSKNASNYLACKHRKRLPPPLILNILSPRAYQTLACLLSLWIIICRHSKRDDSWDYEGSLAFSKVSLPALELNSSLSESLTLALPLTWLHFAPLGTKLNRLHSLHSTSLHSTSTNRETVLACNPNKG